MSNQYPPQPPPPPSQPYGGGGIPPKHPQATTVLILGIIGLICCSIVAPFAWVQGKKVHEEIVNNPGQYSGESEANIGKILGIIGTVLLAISIVIAIIYVIAIVFFATTTTITTY